MQKRPASEEAGRHKVTGDRRRFYSFYSCRRVAPPGPVLPVARNGIPIC
jgi:hypothetical protein